MDETMLAKAAAARKILQNMTDSEFWEFNHGSSHGNVTRTEEDGKIHLSCSCGASRMV